MMSAAQVARICGGEMRGEGGARIAGVRIDSRQIQAGELFVALRGKRAEGSDYAADAKMRGASAAMLPRANPELALPQIVAADCAAALAQLAGEWRARLCGFRGKLALVTGSNGKTTVKGMLANIARADAGKKAVCESEGNFNNALGLPLSLLRLRARHRYAVLEAGMDSPGELTFLGNIAKADVALITNAQRAHLAGFESVAAIARAKGEILQTLPENGAAILNADDEHLPLWRKLAWGVRTVTFGFTEDADVCGRAMEGGVCIAGVGEIFLRVFGAHNAHNALAAAAAARAMGIGEEEIKKGLESFAGTAGRLQFRRGAGGLTVIDDSYNANPDSTIAALQVLAKQPGEKIAALGDMLALGKESAEEHRKLGAHIPKDIRLFAVGEMMQNTVAAAKDGLHCESKKELTEAVQNAVRKCGGGTVAVLVKGSRGMEMETVADALLAEKSESENSESENENKKAELAR